MKNTLNICFILLLIIFFSACEDKVVEKSKRKNIHKKKSVSYMVNKVVKLKENNETLSNSIESEGIVIDGSRDEELLDAFGLAVSQVMVEDGVSVPDCTALAKTEYLTKKECDEISEKYFGFYEILDDGKANKVGDVFSKGIVGSEIKLEESKIEFFDSSGNPLLNNLVEFEELVDNTDEIDVLMQLKRTIPKQELGLRQKIDSKIDFLQEKINFVTNKSLEIDSIQKNQITKTKQIDNIELNNDKIEDFQKEEYDKLVTELNSKNSELTTLIAKHKNTQLEYNKYPSNEKIVNRFNDEETRISILESEIDSLKSQIESGY